MKKIAFLLVLIIWSCIGYSQQKVSQDTTREKTEEVKNSEGASGVRRSIGYKFSLAITEADPGKAIFRFNNNNISRVTRIIVDDIDISGEDQTNWYSTWDKSTGATGRGSIDIAEPGGKLVCEFNITGVFVKSTGYWKIPVEFISGSLPANGATYYYVFNRIAHRKPQPVQEQQTVPSQQPVAQEQAAPAAPAAPPARDKQPARAAQTGQSTRRAEARRTTQAPVTTRTTQTTKTQTETKTTQQVQQPQPSQTKPTTQTTVVAQQVQPVQQAVPEQQAQITSQALYNQEYQAAPYNQVSQVKRPVDISNPYENMSLSYTGRAHRKWYRGIIEIGYAWGIGDYGINNFRFNFINGLMVGRVSSIGLGIGYRRYFEKGNAERYLFSPKSQTPVFLDLRTCFTRNKITPYLAFDIGSSAGYLSAGSDTTATTREGLFLGGSGGIWFNISDRFAVFGGAAFEMQKLEYVLISDHSHFKRNASSISLNIGIAF